MSEEQVLPELDEIAKQEIYEAKDSAFRTDDIYSELDKVRAVLHCRERQLLSILASLAQSEAERERLQGELARERERHQEARRVVKEYRTVNWHGSYCGHHYAHDPCKTCIKADALLESEPAPVATGEEN